MDDQQDNSDNEQPQAQPQGQPAQHQQQTHQQTASQHQTSNQPQKPTIVSKLKAFGKECLRVLRVTKKPNNFEFKTIVKIAGIGILVIGFIGFLIHLIKELFL